MSTPWFRRLSQGLSKSRERLGEQLNVLLNRGPDLDEEFWADLEDALIGSDMGVTATTEMVADLREQSARKALPDASAVLDMLEERIAREFSQSPDLLDESPVTVLVVGINGAGKTTSVGKLAKQAVDQGRSVLLGSADTFRAAASEQLDVWADRAGVDVIRKDRGADPASVAFDSVVAAEQRGADLTLIDTAGRLHTSADLMRELQKVQRVTASRCAHPVRTLLVMDATTGQNGLAQAREFNAAMGVDGIVLTKLDGTSKGGIAVAISRELGIPILRIGVGESIDDLRPFESALFARALVRGE
ncbi:MAG: signal recognition particle-docking protein FtsY [Actinobacteria bacterium HGW-Actinobacteria-7]|jgi:fused signal recognition particle receptor|nr:MAG: signal recognition particle-docking protein FtsY [Actinobacteria bacterium HGW-Actinobacteria-7]